MTDMGKAGEKFEEFVRREAQSYNAPIEPLPREAMWEAIRATREGSGRGSDADVMRPAALGRRTAIYAVLGIAATLVIGVAIGRYSTGAWLGPDVSPKPVVASPVSTVPDSASTSYQLVTAEHLARAEALFVTFGSNAVGDARADAQLAAWARDLLSNTRLLLDSPAARDASRRGLLEDLERVLVQLVQRPPAAGAADERGHIERSLERTQALPRLRSARAAVLNSGT